MEKWVQVNITDTIDVPLKDTWDLAGKMAFTDVTGNRKYDNLPRIVRTKPLRGDFSKSGDARVIHFSTGDTLIESILIKDAPRKFEYEITRASLPMKWVAYRARGIFLYSALDNRTIVSWTYYFHQKNLISKYFIHRYINTTHKAWMTDMSKTGKLMTEKAYANAGKK